MYKDGHFSSDVHGAKTSPELFPKTQPKLRLGCSQKANLVSRAALGGHKQ